MGSNLNLGSRPFHQNELIYVHTLYTAGAPMRPQVQQKRADQTMSEKESLARKLRSMSAISTASTSPAALLSSLTQETAENRHIARTQLPQSLVQKKARQAAMEAVLAQPEMTTQDVLALRSQVALLRCPVESWGRGQGADGVALYCHGMSSAGRSGSWGSCINQGPKSSSGGCARGARSTLPPAGAVGQVCRAKEKRTLRSSR